ncbi:molybdopterin molybdotransferase MoeA [Qipengyuania qiaonensis]|uniref:Molybdopterin molybdenumtransferase n=1 Tax=Qipengyuania qiaonensis TaxID=2867240 RepID=A0ABS7J3R0_9SPHN|nr:molybdopterin molybdotransferase MoeA [Qipengyuania qiaonensis]MBX7480946.1 molybdopterin molybdotransferase MoeA [Qipengyuania qiaonensis]
MISFDDAMSLLADNIVPLDAEVVALADAAERRLAEDVVARLPSPRKTVSAMDGYAVRLKTVAAGSTLRIVGESRPGRPHLTSIAKGEAVRIFTGAPIPENADGVIIQEYAERDGDNVRFAEGFGPSAHVRHRGSDFDKGDVLLSSGTKLDPGSLVAAAAADLAEVRVHRRPIVALLATGDELAAPGFASKDPYAIPDSITFALASQIVREGGTVMARSLAKDDLPGLEKQAGGLLPTADIVVVTGGASVGERDFAKPMFKSHGLELIFDRVAIKPGKPVWLGRAAEKLVLGLPGNPTSAMVTARLFLRPILAMMQGGEGSHSWRRMALTGDIPATGERETFARAAWEEDGLRPLSNQDSGVQGGLARAEWLIRCPPGRNALSAGSLVPAIQF